MKGESVERKNNKFSFKSKEAIGLMACLLFVSMLFVFRIVIINRYVMGLLGLIIFVIAFRNVLLMLNDKRNGFLIWIVIIVLNLYFIVVMSLVSLVETFSLCSNENIGTEKQDRFIVDVYENNCGALSGFKYYIVVRKVILPYFVYIRTFYHCESLVVKRSNTLFRKVLPLKNFLFWKTNMRIDGAAIGMKNKDYNVILKHDVEY
ncbi:MAG: hypothetical protein JXR81_02835 [Candidatus Goldbacteria bacterium]|nr:hypothetical protein [Candidatus Goldiibacteriota bacterium]